MKYNIIKIYINVCVLACLCVFTCLQLFDEGQFLDLAPTVPGSSGLIQPFLTHFLN